MIYFITIAFSPFVCLNFAPKVLLILELMLIQADAYDPTRSMKFLSLYFPSSRFAIYFPGPAAHFLLYYIVRILLFKANQDILKFMPAGALSGFC